MKILIVDDEPILNMIMAQVEELIEGSQLFFASSGKEAVISIEENAPDVVVSDIKMPNGDGIYLSDWIENMQGNKPKLIFVTAYSDYFLDKDSKLSAQRILYKPVSAETVAEVTQELFEAAA